MLYVGAGIRSFGRDNALSPPRHQLHTGLLRYTTTLTTNLLTEFLMRKRGPDSKHCDQRNHGKREARKLFQGARMEIKREGR
jgi:hypothetical protein